MSPEAPADSGAGRPSPPPARDAVEKIVLVTRRTRLEGLLERFHTRGQARFYIEREGGDFDAYEREHDDYAAALEILRPALEFGLPVHEIERSLAPTYLFRESDLIVTAGPDGLVANTAKYVGGRPIVAVNPDPARIDGTLAPFTVAQARRAAAEAAAGRARVREVTLAEAVLADGQRLLAFNDLFIGARGHASARYRLRLGGRTERQSSSGVIVSTGAGSTGWLSSTFNMASGLAAAFGGGPVRPARLDWEDARLLFVVREPFASRESQAFVTAGALAAGEELVLESLMPTEGTVFSDGVEADALAFDSGAVARIRAAAERARLVAPSLDHAIAAG